MKRWFFPLIAYLTIIHSALTVTVVVSEHFSVRAIGGSANVWGIEFTTIDSAGSLTLLCAAAWTTLLAIGCLLKTRRRPETHCRKCDYILRGLREAKCPECGEAI